MFDIIKRDRFLNPFREIFEFNKSFENIFDSEFKTEIKENENSYILEMNLPEYDKDSIKIEVNDKYLTISADKNFEKEEKDIQGNYIKYERSYGSFKRSFDISSIKYENIKTEYQDGTLKLILPKKEQSFLTS